MMMFLFLSGQLTPFVFLIKLELKSEVPNHCLRGEYSLLNNTCFRCVTILRSRHKHLRGTELSVMFSGRFTTNMSGLLC